MSINEICRAFGVPPYIIGAAPAPRDAEEAARHRLVYANAAGLDPFELGDRDVETVVTADYFRQIGESEAANDLLRSLRARRT